MRIQYDDDVPPRDAIGLVVAERIDVDLARDTVRREYRYATGGQILGFSSIIGGCTLFIHGVAGNTSWTAEVLGLKSNVTDAGPGTVLFIVGLFMVFVTRPKVKLKDILGRK
jgi:hypothetical protein